jgi:hypothetical protein
LAIVVLGVGRLEDLAQARRRALSNQVHSLSVVHRQQDAKAPAANHKDWHVGKQAAQTAAWWEDDWPRSGQQTGVQGIIAQQGQGLFVSLCSS